MKQAAENSTSRVIRRPERREIIAAVDPGSSWVRALIAEASSDGLELLGTGAARSQGISRGHVGSIPAVASTVARALGEAEAAAGREAHSLTVLLGGETIRGLNAAGSTKVESENGRVSARDIDRAMRRAGSIGLPRTRSIVHLLPQRYCIDSVCYTDEALGLAGTRLEAEAHVVSAWHPGIENLRRAIRMAGSHLSHLVAAPLAAYLAAGDDEGGVARVIIDIGGETTKVVACESDRISLTRVIPVGGRDVTRALALKLGIDPESAERIKCAHGAATARVLLEHERDEAVSAAAVDGRRVVEITAQRLAELIEPSITKLLIEVRAVLESGGDVKRFAAGALLAGGGARMKGIDQKASEDLWIPARRLHAGDGDASGPEFASLTGLVRYAAERPSRRRTRPGPRGVSSVISGGWNWLLASF